MRVVDDFDSHVFFVSEENEFNSGCSYESGEYSFFQLGSVTRNAKLYPSEANTGIGVLCSIRHFRLTSDLPVSFLRRNVHVMSRHTSPNKRRVDDAFPIRVKIKIPTGGLGNTVSDIHVWIKENLGPERCQNYSTRGVYWQATAYYFRSMEDAEAFLAAFPSLELADGVGVRRGSTFF